MDAHFPVYVMLFIITLFLWCIADQSAEIKKILEKNQELLVIAKEEKK